MPVERSPSQMTAAWAALNRILSPRHQAQQRGDPHKKGAATVRIILSTSAMHDFPNSLDPNNRVYMPCPSTSHAGGLRAAWSLEVRSRARLRTTFCRLSSQSYVSLQMRGLAGTPWQPRAFRAGALRDSFAGCSVVKKGKKTPAGKLNALFRRSSSKPAASAETPPRKSQHSRSFSAAAHPAPSGRGNPLQAILLSLSVHVSVLFRACHKPFRMLSLCAGHCHGCQLG